MRQREAIDLLLRLVERRVVAALARPRRDLPVETMHDAEVVGYHLDVAVVVVQREQFSRCVSHVYTR